MTITKTYKQGSPSYYYSWTEDELRPHHIWDHSYHPRRLNAAYESTRTGVNNPGWRDKIRNGTSATTPLVGHKRTMQLTDWSTDVTVRADIGITATLMKPRKIVHVGNGPSVYSTPTFSSMLISASAAENTALMQTYKAIRNDYQHFAGLTFLGELRESYKMIRRPALALRQGLEDYLKALKRRSRGVPYTKRGKARRSKILTDTWLEYSFGWAPLLSETGKAAEALARFNGEKDGFVKRRSKVSGYGETQAAVLEGPNTGSLPPLAQLNYIWFKKSLGTKSVRFQVGLNYSTAVPSGSAKRLAQLSGFSLAEFVPTAWGLVPWSFLVDYFSNVGDVLEAFATPTGNIGYINRTERMTNETYFRSRVDTRTTMAIPGYLGHKEGDSGCGGYDSRYVHVIRSASGALNLPRFELQNPFGSNEVRRSLNLLSLANGHRSLKPFF